MSPLPVIGVPVKSSNSIDGWDSTSSILQMPGVPGDCSIEWGQNAGILAAQIIGQRRVLNKVIQYGLKNLYCFESLQAIIKIFKTI
jgi:5-(carboxyamino)imidazole ribonucleotide mutase